MGSLGRFLDNCSVLSEASVDHVSQTAQRENYLCRDTEAVHKTAEICTNGGAVRDEDRMRHN